MGKSLGLLNATFTCRIIKDKFSEMCPIFKNVDIPFEATGEQVQNFVQQNGLSKKPRRGLVGSMFGNKILLTTPLLRWSINHGLKVTKVYEVIEYAPKNCFSGFADDVSNVRREGDRDPSTAVIADTMKLHGNSGYGSTLTNKEKHLDIQYCNEANIGLAVNNPHFRKLYIIDENFYEVSKTKKSISMNLPIQIGFFVYQYAKLRKLRFGPKCVRASRKAEREYFKKIFPFLLVAYETLLVCQVSEKLIF